MGKFGFKSQYPDYVSMLADVQWQHTCLWHKFLTEKAGSIPVSQPKEGTAMVLNSLENCDPERGSEFDSLTFRYDNKQF